MFHPLHRFLQYKFVKDIYKKLKLKKTDPLGILLCGRTACMPEYLYFYGIFYFR